MDIGKLTFNIINGKVLFPCIAFSLLMLFCGCKPTDKISIDSNSNIFLKNHGQLPVSLKCPDFVMSGNHYCTDQQPKSVEIKPAPENTLTAIYKPLTISNGQTLDVKVIVKLFPQEKTIRKWVQFKLNGTPSLIAEEIVFERMDKAGLLIPLAGGPPQSYPVFINNYYLGVEFPIASTRVVDNEVLIAHKPSIEIVPGKWYSSRKVICGITEKGKEKDTFFQYISDNRPSPKGFHLNYNSWWTSSVPFTRDEILGLMDEFQKNLYEPYGVCFDTFAIDMGWSTKDKVWEIDKKMFPNGFIEIQEKIKKMDGRLGLWISPSNMYSPGSFDNDMAEKDGYETTNIEWGPRKFKVCCLGGEKYSTRYRKSLVDMVKKYEINHIKFDGYYLTCPEKDHGHLPGELSTEAIAMGSIKAWQAIRKVAPDIWFEATCFVNPSPWWLFYVNSVIGMHGDDAPYGRVPCPVYRESYTTARDYFSLQGAAIFPMPDNAQEVLGIIHQTDNPFLNDGVTTIMRGHMFVPLYVNPQYMNNLRWHQMAQLIKWAKNNAYILENTKIILPEGWQNGWRPHLSDEGTMPRQLYGYSHFNNEKGLVHLRNPWIEVQSYSLKLDESIGVVKEMKNFNVVSLYPQTRIYGKNLSYGQTLKLKLAPYETLVLEFSDKDIDAKFPAAEEVIDVSLDSEIIEKSLTQIGFLDMQEPYGHSWTSLAGDFNSAIEMKLKGRVSVNKGDGKLLVLLESDEYIHMPEYNLAINGKKSEFAVSGTEGAWAATGLSEPQKWMFLIAELPKKENDFELNIYCSKEKTKISIWTLSQKTYGSFVQDDYPNALCYPEIMYLDSDKLIDNVDFSLIPNNGFGPIAMEFFRPQGK